MTLVRLRLKGMCVLLLASLGFVAYLSYLQTSSARRVLSGYADAISMFSVLQLTPDKDNDICAKVAFSRDEIGWLVWPSIRKQYAQMSEKCPFKAFSRATI